MMIVTCPHCGGSVIVGGLGRKRLGIPLNIVLEALRVHRSVKEAAKKLKCSEAYIFKALKGAGLKLKGVLGSG